MDDKDVEKRAWDVAVAIAREAVARYGVVLHISVAPNEPGYKMCAIDLVNMVEWTQIMSIEFLDDAEVLESFMVDRFLRQIDKGMK